MNILVAVDQEPESAEAAAAAKSFFGDDHHYIFLSIADFVTSAAFMRVGYSLQTAGLADEIEVHARETATAAAHKHAEQTGMPDREIAIEVGSVGRTICEHALTSEADMIVMGSRERSLWDRIFDPSAGRYVIDHAPCPVLVVR
ncbi:MAG: nucleotide-binding universal stress UspA family protein [Ilumatobacter sp.]|jgi:nucleotide-binding universal stress UspA family protein